MEGRLQFDDQAFIANYDHFRRKTVGETGAVVKANAYGTGSERAVRLLNAVGCRHFFVANLPEAMVVDSVGKGCIYVMSGPLGVSAAQEMANRKLIPFLNSERQLEMWRTVGNFPCAVQVDTGMQRLGLSVDACRRADWGSVDVCLFLTHLACADTPEHPMNQQQCEAFDAALEIFPNVPTSIGNSAGILNGEEFQGDVARPGIGLYGGNPWRDRRNPMQTVVTCEGVVMQMRTVREGDSVGYGASYVAKKRMRVATIGLGYADGIPWRLSNRGSFAHGAVRMPIVGQVSMDATQIDCSNHKSLREGDFVQFIGDQVSLDEVARLAGTIPYEILTGLGARIQRC